MEKIEKQVAIDVLSSLLQVLQDLEPVFSFRIKSLSSRNRKVKAGRQLNDIIGIRVIVSPHRLREAVRRIIEWVSSTEGEPPSVEVHRGEKLGYHGVHVNLHRDGVPVEVQVHTYYTNAFATVCHPLYKGEVADPEIKRRLEEAVDLLKPLVEAEFPM